MYTLGGNFMKSLTTSTLISGASNDLGLSDAAPRPPPRPAGGVCAPPVGACAPPGGVCPPLGGVWAPPWAVWANRVRPADSASAAVTAYAKRVFIGHLENGAKCNTGSRPPHIRRGFEHKVRRRRAGILVSDAAISEITRTPLARRHGLGGLDAGFGRCCAAFQDFRQATSSFESTSHRLHGGKQCIKHGLIPECGFAALLHAFDPGLKQRHHIGGREFGFPCARRSGAQKKSSDERPRTAAHCLDENSRDVLKNSA